jgi:hypothetical protein
MIARMTALRGVAAWMLGLLVAGSVGGCGGGGPTAPAADAAAALVAVTGPLPEGCEILWHESRGGSAAAWIIRTPGRWRPHESVDHRHKTLPTDTFMNLVAATAQGKVDPGRPTASSCRYTEWRLGDATDGRRDVRIYQLATDRGELTVLETLPDPAGG